MLLAVLDLKCLAETIGKAVPEMARAYARGFALAWLAGELDIRETTHILYYKEQATDAFAMGHLSFVIAVLSAVAFYLSKGNFDREILLQQVSNSKLGPEVANWIAANEGKIVKHPALQPMMSQAVKDGGEPASIGGVAERASGGVTEVEKKISSGNAPNKLTTVQRIAKLDLEGHAPIRHGGSSGN